jgi:alginate O-acetyltransferase complex protein AlgI
MTFVSLSFLVFFAAVLAGLAIMPSRSSRQAFLLVMNLVFYGSGTPWFLAVLLVPSLVDYACALRMEAAGDERARRQWLVLSLVVNLGILAYFKYANFLADNIAALFGTTSAKLDIVLPVGISFFTFKTMSYTIDVHRRRIPACRSLWRYAMFVSFFPELVAGPIVRASVFLPQLERPLTLSWTRTVGGTQSILLGLTKKLLVADRLAVFIDPVFANPAAYSGATVASAVVAYSLQIYADFSGYTDIAIGVARIVGFDLPENFNMPYIARSITDFWRRWHMTLSQWLRDYLYIPLGGNRRGAMRTYVNLMLTMLIGGLWHGANWTFVAWGAWHGIGLAAHKLWSSRDARIEWIPRPVADVLAWAATYAFVCIGWIFFRAPNMATAGLVLRKVAGVAPGGVHWFFLPLVLLGAGVAVAHAYGAGSSVEVRDDHVAGAAPRLLPSSSFAAGLVFTAWIVLLFLFVPLHRSPFIYFQF